MCLIIEIIHQIGLVGKRLGLNNCTFLTHPEIHSKVGITGNITGNDRIYKAHKQILLTGLKLSQIYIVVQFRRVSACT